MSDEHKEAVDLIDQKSDDILESLLSVQRSIQDLDVVPDADKQIDVRLRYHDGDLYLHSGDPQYDQDHRGFWAAGIVGPDSDLEDVRDELSRELKDVIAQHGGGE